MITRSLLVLAFLAPLGGTALAQAPRAPEPVPSTVKKLVPHRAVYEMSLLRAGRSNFDTVRGRLVFDLSGGPCIGWTLDFKQALELKAGDNGVTFVVQTATFESPDGREMRVVSRQSGLKPSAEAVDLVARREPDQVRIAMKKPEEKEITAPPETFFPMQHMAAVIAAAEDGKTIYERKLFDGGDTGERIYDTTTIIGRQIEPGKPFLEAPAMKDGLEKLRRWPVRMSYFSDLKPGEGTPNYTVGAELLENGITTAMTIDYNDFVIKAELTELTLRQPESCP